MPSRILIVVTSHAQLGTLERKTGYWLGEVSHFQHVVAAAGHSVDYASPRGGEPPLDEKSQEPADALNRAFLAGPELARLNHSNALGDLSPADYHCIYFAGGHGAMWDFNNASVGDFAAAVHAAGGVVATVCHGAAAWLSIKKPDGRHLIDGQEVTGFANLEERLIRLGRQVPYMLEDELRRTGAHYKKALLPFCSFVTTSDRLISGQNPQSAKATAEAVVRALG